MVVHVTVTETKRDVEVSPLKAVCEAPDGSVGPANDAEERLRRWCKQPARREYTDQTTQRSTVQSAVYYTQHNTSPHAIQTRRQPCYLPPFPHSSNPRTQQQPHSKLTSLESLAARPAPRSNQQSSSQTMDVIAAAMVPCASTGPPVFLLCLMSASVSYLSTTL